MLKILRKFTLPARDSLAAVGPYFLLYHAWSPAFARISTGKLVRESGDPGGAPYGGRGPVKKAAPRKYWRGPVAVHRAGPPELSPALFPLWGPEANTSGSRKPILIHAPLDPRYQGLRNKSLKTNIYSQTEYHFGFLSYQDLYLISA